LDTRTRDGCDVGEWSVTGGRDATGVVSTGGVVVATTVADLAEPEVETEMTRLVQVLSAGRLVSELLA
jgi:hypothetical protein